MRVYTRYAEPTGGVAFAIGLLCGAWTDGEGLT